MALLRWGGAPVAHLHFEVSLRGDLRLLPSPSFVGFPASWTLLSWSSLFFLVEPILHYLPEKGCLGVNSETSTTWNVCFIITVSDSVIEYRILCWGIIVSFEFWKHYSIAFNSKKYKVVLIPDPLVRSLSPYFPGAQGLPSISQSNAFICGSNSSPWDLITWNHMSSGSENLPFHESPLFLLCLLMHPVTSFLLFQIFAICSIF